MTIKNLSAFTSLPTDRSPAFVSINTSLDEQSVTISVRSLPKEGEVYGPEAQITMDRASFSELLLNAVSNFGR